MLLIRPAIESDLDQIMELIQDTGHGLTSLPKDRDFIHNKILKSARCIVDIGDKPKGESFLFVLIDVELNKVIGINGIISRIGGFDAYYFNRITSENKELVESNIKRKLTYFQMEKTHKGPAEVCSLFLSPKYRKSPNGRFLSLSRFLFMAQNIKSFERFVIAEMRGMVNDDGTSPFWNAVGKKITGMSFIDADNLYARNKGFIENLFPQEKMLVDLLPEDAQEIIGKVHPHTIPARKMLEAEGFEYNGLIGILEPGPILECNITNIRAIKESKLVTVDKIQDEEITLRPVLICNATHAKDFKATLSSIKEEAGEIIIDRMTATILQISAGDKIRFTGLRPTLIEQKELI